MGLFSKAQADAINKVAQQAQAALQPVTSSKSSSAYEELNSIYAEVEKYFSDSDAICITTKEELHTYVTALIESGIAGIDCETTGLNRQKDYMVGFSLYYPGGVHAYIPLKHRVPIFEDLYKGQMTYEDATIELNRIVESKTRLIFANADFDLSFFYKDLKVDLCNNFYYDVIQAWRVLKENEPKNDLKTLYNKYVLKGKGDPKRFSDFFSPKLFPYCKPEIAKLYAAYDAKITYKLYEWQLPYCTKTSDKCKHHKLEKLSDLIWHVEFPMIVACQKLHRTGFYIDKEVAANIAKRYKDKEAYERKVLQDMVQELLNNTPVIPLTTAKTRPFTSGKEFNPKSQPHVKYLLYDVMGLPKIGDGGTGKAVISELNLPITNQILKVRSLGTLISTFTDKIPKDAWADSRIHAQFKVSGADTGRMSSAEPCCKIWRLGS